MTSYSVAARGQSRVSRPRPASSHRHLLTFSILAALPLAITAVAAIKVTTALTSPNALRSVMMSGTNIPSAALKPSLAAPALTLKAAHEVASVATSQPDPVADFVDNLGVEPTHVDYRVVSGDSLLGIFDKLNVENSDARAAVIALKAAKLDNELKLRPHQRMLIELGGTADQNDVRPLLSASIRLDPARKLKIERSTDGDYTASIAQEELTPHTYLARGVITSSLASAAADQGVSNGLVAKFANIYAYDVDFQRDLHPDDTFEIYYTQYANDEGDVDPSRGEILFSRLSFGGKVKTYYRYASADGKTVDYYDAHGKSARTFLMRTPVDGARISSTFGMRKHPILGYTRMHQGVDFAAPIGTKIYAAGAGVIERAGRNGGYGNFVEIKHANGYETEYGHLSRYAKGIHAGVRVAQGEVIGYVGSTGLSTGPHLHYGVIAHGHFVNPMSVRVPTGTKLAGAELDRFKAQVERVDVALKSNPANQVAAAGDDTSSATH